MINEVRNTVLSILNKNNYGYISPSDFNLFAANAQMEIWEEYYSSYNKVINAENQRLSGTDYADIENPIAETLETFVVSKNLTNFQNNRYFVPSLFTTGDEAYYLLKILCYTNKLTNGTNTSVVPSHLIDSTATFLSDGLSVGDVVANGTTGLNSTILSIVSDTNLELTTDIFGYNPNSYSIFKPSSLKEADKVSLGKITMLNTSPLTAPSNEFPSYTYEGNKVELYPSTIKYPGQVSSVYFRYPKTPKWTYIELSTGEPAFDQSQLDYQDFELPNEDAYKLTTKILEYCGISIREMEVTQFGMTQQAHEQPTFSVQQ